MWHDLLNDYKNMGGRVTASSDAGYIYNLMGFSTIQEMELLQHAGFHPLEVIRAATMHAAETLFKPTGRPIEFGVVRRGLLADLVIVEENPIHNLKVLYGTGARRLNDETGEVETVARRSNAQRSRSPRRRSRDGRGTEARHDHHHRRRRFE